MIVFAFDGKESTTRNLSVHSETFCVSALVVCEREMVPMITIAHCKSIKIYCGVTNYQFKYQVKVHFMVTIGMKRFSRNR